MTVQDLTQEFGNVDHMDKVFGLYDLEVKHWVPHARTATTNVPLPTADLPTIAIHNRQPPPC